jgi:hypothetical protein
MKETASPSLLLKEKGDEPQSSVTFSTESLPFSFSRRVRDVDIFFSVEKTALAVLGTSSPSLSLKGEG